MNFSEFFAEGQNMGQIILFAIVFIACWNLEHFFGVSKASYNKWKHLVTNFLFILPGGIMQLILGFLFVKVLLWENANGFGLLPRLNIASNWSQIIVSFVVLDFFYYLYHLFMHKVNIAWRFHENIQEKL
jgi:sterol desaturase/sphingolipid hydroxylase (fatty acid hydroxylase superfamily)